MTWLLLTDFDEGDALQVNMAQVVSVHVDGQMTVLTLPSGEELHVKERLTPTGAGGISVVIG